MGSALQNVVEVGRDLIAVKAALGHGRFLGWIEAEFQMSETTARNFVRVAEVFGAKSATVADLPLTALYELAAPSTPDEVRDAVVERAAVSAINGSEPTRPQPPNLLRY